MAYKFKKLILFPFGGNAREAVVVIEAINRIQREWDVAGFIDDNKSLKGKGCCGVQVLGGRDVLRKYKEAFILAVPGNPGNYLKRQQLIGGLQWDSAKFARIIHPGVAVGSDSKIGYNTLIMSQVTITTGVRVGNHCIILPNTTISHDAVVGDYSCIGSQVAISGSVIVGENCYIGSGTTVRDGTTIGGNALVGMGSNVVKNVGKGLTVAGNPAQILRKK